MFTPLYSAGLAGLINRAMQVFVFIREIIDFLTSSKKFKRIKVF
jgi:hypothetical protein